MTFYSNFKKELLPGNYALTKSMELNKIQSSGTLWYTKKFLTLYYFVFLSNEIMTNEYVLNVIDIFDNYILTLDSSVQKEAKEFFYPRNEAINFKSKKFNKFMSFAGKSSFDNQEDKNTYYQNAKKYYFSLLMGSGGQTGVKKYLKESVQQPGFVYSSKNIDNAIMDAIIRSCIESGNTNNTITDNSVKYIISEKAMNGICKLSTIKTLNKKNVKELIDKYPNNNPKYRSIENDMIAFIRNERQILYYYGFFHSKTSGATDFEFSSLTPIGELALKANALEFQIIWEHQKIKMISQPATADINEINGIKNGKDYFHISYTPYTNILGHLARRGSMTLAEYKYIVSRRKSVYSNDDWENNEQELIDNIDEIKKHIFSFGRKRDIAEEDSRKELLKYLLGIYYLQNDKNSNVLCVCDFNRSVVEVTDSKSLSLLYDIYTKLDDYKLLKYGSIFKDSEADLRNRYVLSSAGAASEINQKTKINWDLYNIKADKFIILSTMVAFSMIKLGYPKIDRLSKADVNKISTVIFDCFKFLCKNFKLKSLASIRREISQVINSINNDEYSYFLDLDEEHEQALAAYKNESASDLMIKIKNLSSTTSVSYSEDRTRNMALISLIKSYYMVRFSTNNLLKCECCGEETFVTGAGEPYVEFHHLIPFNIAYGPDHYLNLFALCPNCHRKIHFLTMPQKGIQYGMLNNNNYLKLHFIDRLKELKQENLLRSYHLEYLLADNAISAEEYNMIAS